MKILVAEDDLTSRISLLGILKKLGYEVVAVADGLEALAAMKADPSLRLALLDWSMPGMDGIEVCVKAKIDKALQHIYIIMLTAKNENSEMVLAFEAGADDFIAKPPDISVMNARIKAGLRTATMQDKLRDFAADMEKLASERALQLAHADRLSTLGLLSAGVAHEINNPATNISINLQIIEKNWPGIMAYIEEHMKQPPDDKTALLLSEMPSMVQEMHQGVMRITKIVEGLKSFARTDHGARRVMDVHECVDEALKLCFNKLKKTIAVTKHFAKNLPQIKVDERQLEQVLVNLFVNAADAMREKDKGTLDIRTAYFKDRIIISIRDNGPGIPAEYMNKIFKPFFTSKEIGEGTGLGLYVSQNIIEAHGGAISAVNQKDGGAEFLIELPQVTKEEKQ